VTITDNDNAGINITPTTGLTTTEAGGTATFTVSLDTEPTANVNIALSSSDTTEGTVPGSVTLTPATYTGVIVTITGQDDNFDDGNIAYTIVTGPVTSGDPVYNGWVPVIEDVSVSNIDDDTAGVIITPTSGLVTTEDGEQDIFRVRLTAQPTANVVIQLSSSDPSEGTVPTSVTILPGQWNTDVDVIVSGVDDTLLDGDIAYTIVTGDVTSSTDAAFDALDGGDVDNVSVTNTDDDTAAVTIANVSGDENGGPITVTAILDNAVPGGFTLDVSTSDISATAGSDYTAVTNFQLTFIGTPGEQQTFTVSPIGDTAIEPNETLQVSMSNLSTILPVDITDTAIVTINNDDSSTISIDDPASVPE
jgi:hypothetical protein